MMKAEGGRMKEEPLEQRAVFRVFHFSSLIVHPFPKCITV
jgi:hypothetical protein